jgi:hypothetical protein
MWPRIERISLSSTFSRSWPSNDFAFPDDPGGATRRMIDKGDVCRSRTQQGRGSRRAEKSINGDGSTSSSRSRNEVFRLRTSSRTRHECRVI